MSGMVYSVLVSAYDFVPMGADLIRVADLKNVQIRANFDEPEIGKLKAGQDVLSLGTEGLEGFGTDISNKRRLLQSFLGRAAWASRPSRSTMRRKTFCLPAKPGAGPTDVKSSLFHLVRVE